MTDPLVAEAKERLKEWLAKPLEERQAIMRRLHNDIADVFDGVEHIDEEV